MASPIPTGPPPTTTTSATSADDFIADHSRARICGPAKGMSGYSSRLDPPRQSPDGGVRLAQQPQLALSPRSNAVYAARDGAATTFCGDRQAARLPPLRITPPIAPLQGSAEQPQQPCPKPSEQPEQGHDPRASRPRCRVAEHATAGRLPAGLCATPHLAPGRGVVFSCPVGQRMRIYLPHNVPARCWLDRWE